MDPSCSWLLLGGREAPINLDVQVGPKRNRLYSELLTQHREDPLYGGEGGIRGAPLELRHQLLAHPGSLG